MSVHYKFNSGKETHTVTFDDLHISLGDLKKTIMQQRKIGKTADLDLQIVNAQTKEVYDNDSILIPKNTSVIVARIPAANATGKKHWKKQGNDQNEQNSSNNNRQAANYSSITMETKNDETEEEKIKKMMVQSTKDFDPSKYVRGKGPMGPPPPNYICHRCGKQGHYIKNCPTNNNDVKRSTGIPRCFMVPVNSDQKGAMMTANGEYVAHIVDLAGYKKVKKDKPPFLETEETSKPEPKVEIPEELACPLCKNLMEDAVLIPCCGNCYCDECIRLYLLDSDNHQCPNCKATDVSPDTLIPNRFQRSEVAKFKNENGIQKSMVKKIEEQMKVAKSESEDNNNKTDNSENKQKSIITNIDTAKLNKSTNGKTINETKDEKKKEDDIDILDDDVNDDDDDSSSSNMKTKSDTKKDYVDLDDLILLGRQTSPDVGKNKNATDDDDGKSSKKEDDHTNKKQKETSPQASSIESLASLSNLPMQPFPFGPFVGGQEQNKGFRNPIRVRSSTQAPIFNRPPGLNTGSVSLPPIPPPPPIMLAPMGLPRVRNPLLPGDSTGAYFNPLMYGAVPGMLPPYAYGTQIRNATFNQLYGNRSASGVTPLLPYPGMPPLPPVYDTYGGGRKKLNDYEDQLDRFNRHLESNYYRDERDRERRSGRRARSRSRSGSSTRSRSSPVGHKSGSSRRTGTTSSSSRHRDRDRYERDGRRHRAESPRGGYSPPQSSNRDIRSVHRDDRRSPHRTDRRSSPHRSDRRSPHRDRRSTHRDDRRSAHRDDRHRPGSPSKSKYDKRAYYTESKWRVSRSRSRDRGDSAIDNSKRHKSSSVIDSQYPERRYSRDRSPFSGAESGGKEIDRQRHMMSPEMHSSHHHADDIPTNFGHDCSNLIDIKLNGADDDYENSSTEAKKDDEDRGKVEERQKSPISKESDSKRKKSDRSHHREKKETRRSGDEENTVDDDRKKSSDKKEHQKKQERKDHHHRDDGDNRKSSLQEQQQEKSETVKKISSSKSNGKHREESPLSKRSPKLSTDKRSGESKKSGEQKSSSNKSDDQHHHHQKKERKDTKNDDESKTKEHKKRKENNKPDAMEERKSSSTNQDRDEKEKKKRKDEHQEKKEKLIGKEMDIVVPVDTIETAAPVADTVVEDGKPSELSINVSAVSMDQQHLTGEPTTDSKQQHHQPTAKNLSASSSASSSSSSSSESEEGEYPDSDQEISPSEIFNGTKGQADAAAAGKSGSGEMSKIQEEDYNDRNFLESLIKLDTSFSSVNDDDDDDDDDGSGDQNMKVRDRDAEQTGRRQSRRRRHDEDRKEKIINSGNNDDDDDDGSDNESDVDEKFDGTAGKEERKQVDLKPKPKMITADTDYKKNDSDGGSDTKQQTLLDLPETDKKNNGLKSSSSKNEKEKYREHRHHDHHSGKDRDRKKRNKESEHRHRSRNDEKKKDRKDDTEKDKDKDRKKSDKNEKKSDSNPKKVSSQISISLSTTEKPSEKSGESSSGTKRKRTPDSKRRREHSPYISGDDDYGSDANQGSRKKNRYSPPIGISERKRHRKSGGGGVNDFTSPTKRFGDDDTKNSGAFRQAKGSGGGGGKRWRNGRRGGNGRRAKASRRRRQFN